jgi:pyrroline-5-carboxylate reductase
MCSNTKKANDAILLVGAGRMGSALLNGLITLERFHEIDVVEPTPSQTISTLAGQSKITLASEFKSAGATPSAVVLALKPEVLKREATLVENDRATNSLAVSIADERLMEVVTALCGSGPAYVFLLAEEMTNAGNAQGLPPNLATRLVRTTIVGASALLDADPRSPEELRRDVPSARGPTEAALKVLICANGLESLMLRAIAAAAQRSKELA